MCTTRSLLRGWRRVGAGLGMSACGLLGPARGDAQQSPSPQRTVPPPAQHVVVVVSAASSIPTLTKVQVSDIFLKKLVKWNRQTLVPVDRERTAKVRELFSTAVHGRSTETIVAYWNIQIFSGREIPPDTRASDAAVLAFVRVNPNAIGYVTPGTPLGTDVKVVWRE
jgi:ABC-type phosphate transport system substrate-binding protein